MQPIPNREELRDARVTAKFTTLMARIVLVQLAREAFQRADRRLHARREAERRRKLHRTMLAGVGVACLTTAGLVAARRHHTD